MYNNVPYIIRIQGIIYCSKLLSDTHEEKKKREHGSLLTNKAKNTFPLASLDFPQPVNRTHSNKYSEL